MVAFNFTMAKGTGQAKTNGTFIILCLICDFFICDDKTDCVPPVGQFNVIAAIMPSCSLLSISTVFTVQDRPGPGREEDREAARKTDETHGVQGDAQWFHGDRLKHSRGADLLEHLD